MLHISHVIRRSELCAVGRLYVILLYRLHFIITYGMQFYAAKPFWNLCWKGEVEFSVLS